MLWRWLRLALLIVAIAAGGGLVFHRDAYWVFRLQLRQLLHQADTARYCQWAGFRTLYEEDTPAGAYQSRLQHAAQQHPNDYRAQLAASLLHRSAEREQLLLELLPRFGERPALLAHILRFHAKKMHISRPEADIMHRTVQLNWFPFMGGPIAGVPPIGGAPVPKAQPPFLDLYSLIFSKQDMYTLWLRLFVPPLPSQSSLSSERLSSQQLATFIQIAKRGEQVDPGNAFFPAMLAAAYLAERRDAEAIDALLRAGRKTRWEDYTNDEIESFIHLHTLASGTMLSLNRLIFLYETLFHYTTALRVTARTAVYLAYLSDVDGNPEQGAQIRLALLHVGELMRVQAHRAPMAVIGCTITYIGAQAMPELSIGEIRPKNPYSDRAQRLARYLRRLGKLQEARWATEQLQVAQTARTILEMGSSKMASLASLFVELGSAWRASFRWLVLSLMLWCLWIVCTMTDQLWRNRAHATCIALGITLIAILAWLRRSELLPFTAEMWLTSYMFAQNDLAPPGVISYVLDFLRQTLGLYSDAEADIRSVCFAWVAGFTFAALFLIGVMSLPLLVRDHPLYRVIIDGIRSNGPLLASLFFLLYVLSVLYTASQEHRASEMLHQLMYREPQYYAHLLGTKWPD